jgi:hypothetical protein
MYLPHWVLFRMLPIAVPGDGDVSSLGNQKTLVEEFFTGPSKVLNLKDTFRLRFLILSSLFVSV